MTRWGHTDGLLCVRIGRSTPIACFSSSLCRDLWRACFKASGETNLDHLPMSIDKDVTSRAEISAQSAQSFAEAQKIKSDRDNDAPTQLLSSVEVTRQLDFPSLILSDLSILLFHDWIDRSCWEYYPGSILDLSIYLLDHHHNYHWSSGLWEQTMWDLFLHFFTLRFIFIAA